jgi:hypothetical protein
LKATSPAPPGSSVEFPIPDRFTVSGLVLGDLCLTCLCRVIELGGGEEGMVLAWCDCGWPEDAHEMEILSVAGSG